MSDAQKVDNSAKMFHGILSTVTVVIVLVSIGLAGWYLRDIHRDQQESKRQMELLNLNFIKQNQQTLLLQIIDTKMGASVPAEVKVDLANTIYSLCAVKKTPVSLICGLIDVESGWNPNAVSGSNAKGLMQVLPSSARPYLRAEKVDYDPSVLVDDPVLNVTVGISLLADYQAAHIEAGYAKEGDFTMSLHSYFWGISNTLALYGKKDSRVNVPNMSYPQRVIQAAKSYQNILHD